MLTEEEVTEREGAGAALTMAGEEEEDDDIHLCIKCNTEIIGLGNYIEHRKSFCSTTKLIRTQRTQTAAAATSSRTVTETERIVTEEGGGSGEESASVPKSTSSVVETSSLEVVTNPGQLKLNAPPGGGQEEEMEKRNSAEQNHHRDGKSPEGGGGGRGFGMKLMETSFEEEHFEDSHFAAEKVRAIEKSLVPFHLDYDLMSGQRRTSSGGGKKMPLGTTTTEELDYSYDYDDADLFFSSLQLQSSSKRNSNVGAGGSAAGLGKSSTTVGRGLGKGINLMVKPAQLYRMSDDDSEVEDEEPEDEDEDEESDSIVEMDEEEESDLDEERPPRSHTGGKWKPEHRQMQATATKFTGGSSWTILKDEEYSRAMSPPPLNYTRGKWVPGKEPVANSPTSIIRGSSMSPSSAKSAIKSNHHQQQQQQQQQDQPPRVPPDNHNHPRATYWCSVCNRQLASLKIFEKHLQSNLHRKQEALEIELEQPRRMKMSQFPGEESNRNAATAAATTHRTRSTAGSDTVGRRYRELVGAASLSSPRKRKSSTTTITSSSADPQSHSITPSDVNQQPSDLIISPREGDRTADTDNSPLLPIGGEEESKLKSPKHSKRNLLKRLRKPRRKLFMYCQVCEVRLRILLLGRHLISHRHVRRMQMGGRRRMIADSMVLENFEQVVRLLPFQCQICRFFATTEEMFMRHWRDKSHRHQVVAQNVTRLWCSFCDGFAGSPAEMDEHLMGAGHQGVVQAFSQTVSIVIRARRSLICSKCGGEFRFNFALRRHQCKGAVLDKDGVTLSEGNVPLDGKGNTASDQYQSIIACNECGMKFRTVRLLKKHTEKWHDLRTFPCQPCSLDFDSSEAVAKHRQTLEHRVAAHKLKMGDKTGVCRVCQVAMEDLVQLKRHIAEHHPEELFSCLMCGVKFALSQELSRHVRDKKCELSSTAKKKKEEESIKGMENKLHCSSCPFATISEAELIFHETLSHGGQNFEGKGAKIPCSLCPKSFSKSSLLPHLRRHKGERIFQCPKCEKSYPRKQNVVTHMKICTGGGGGEWLRPVKVIPAATTTSTADDGRGRCSTAPPLDVPTIFRCSFGHCKYSTDSQKKLNRHNEVHMEKTFQCSRCEYRTQTSRYLKRHMVTHSDAGSFQCPHCPMSFRCAANLRKHVLTTSSHSGALLYSCKKCQYKTNYLIDLKRHKCP